MKFFHRNSLRAQLCGALLAGGVASAAVAAQTSPATDHAAIAQVLENYRTAVSSGDEALFSTTLLDDAIPFFAVGDGLPQPAGLAASQLQGVAAFRQRVFHGGRGYTQRFDDIRIAQDGALAQATLHFVTERDDGTGGEGWKILALVLVGGQWKIASEFYTVRALAREDSTAR